MVGHYRDRSFRKRGGRPVAGRTVNTETDRLVVASSGYIFNSEKG